MSGARGRIRVVRAMRWSGPCAILMDGAKVGELWPGQSLEIDAGQGDRELSIRLGIYRSRPHPVAVTPGATVEVELESPRFFELDRLVLGAIGLGRPLFRWRARS